MKRLFKDFEVAICKTTDLNQALTLASAYGNLLWFADVGIHDAPLVETDLIERYLTMGAQASRQRPKSVEGFCIL